jgi:hypothetical protein
MDEDTCMGGDDHDGQPATDMTQETENGLVRTTQMETGEEAPVEQMEQQEGEGEGGTRGEEIEGESQDSDQASGEAERESMEQDLVQQEAERQEAKYHEDNFLASEDQGPEIVQDEEQERMENMATTTTTTATTTGTTTSTPTTTTSNTTPNTTAPTEPKTNTNTLKHMEIHPNTKNNPLTITGTTHISTQANPTTSGNSIDLTDKEMIAEGEKRSEMSRHMDLMHQHLKKMEKEAGETHKYNKEGYAAHSKRLKDTLRRMEWIQQQIASIQKGAGAVDKELGEILEATRATNKYLVEQNDILRKEVEDAWEGRNTIMEVLRGVKELLEWKNIRVGDMEQEHNQPRDSGKRGAEASPVGERRPTKQNRSQEDKEKPRTGDSPKKQGEGREDKNRGEEGSTRRNRMETLPGHRDYGQAPRGNEGDRRHEGHPGGHPDQSGGERRHMEYGWGQQRGGGGGPQNRQGPQEGERYNRDSRRMEGGHQHDNQPQYGRMGGGRDDHGRHGEGLERRGGDRQQRPPPHHGNHHHNMGPPGDGNGRAGQAQPLWNSATQGKQRGGAAKDIRGKQGGAKSDLGKDGKVKSFDGRDHLPGVCTDWATKGTCMFKKKCRFSHKGEGGNATAKPAPPAHKESKDGNHVGEKRMEAQKSVTAQQVQTPEKHPVKETTEEDAMAEAQIAQQRQEEGTEIMTEIKAREEEVKQRERREAKEAETKAQEEEMERVKEHRDKKEKIKREAEAVRLEITRMEGLERVRAEEQEVREAKEEKALLEAKLAQMKAAKQQPVRHGRGNFRAGSYAWSNRDDTAREDDGMEGDTRM